MMNKSLLVLLFVPTLDKENGDGRGKVGAVGTGYPIGKDIILTSRHVLEPANRDRRYPIALLWNDFPHDGPDEGWFPLRDEHILWKGDGDLDAALLRCPRPEKASQYAGELAAIEPPQGRRWCSAGFPRAAKREKREPASFRGHMHSMGANWPYFEIDVDVSPPEEEDWKGASGMPVFAENSTAIYGIIKEIPYNFRSQKAHVVPSWKLLRDKAFKVVLGFRDAPLINLSRFKEEIAKQLEASSKVIRRVESKLDDLGIKKGASHPQIGLTPEKVAANAIAETLIDLEFGDTLELLKVAIESCTTEPEEIERRILFTILCWFLPARYDLQNSEKVCQYYLEGDVQLIEAHVASALAAELRMAAVEGRAAQFDRDALVGKNKLPDPPPLGLGATPEMELIGAVDGYLLAKYSLCTTTFSHAPELYLGSINKNLERARRFRSGVPYLLFAMRPDNSGLSPEALEALAKVIKARYPALTILRLSSDLDVEKHELENLSSLRDILQKK